MIVPMARTLKDDLAAFERSGLKSAAVWAFRHATSVTAGLVVVSVAPARAGRDFFADISQVLVVLMIAAFLQTRVFGPIERPRSRPTTKGRRLAVLLRLAQAGNTFYTVGLLVAAEIQTLLFLSSSTLVGDPGLVLFASTYTLAALALSALVPPGGEESPL
jgi:hypothetical protein